ncbi:EAL domain-containing response regulator [Halomonas sp. HP20-15]|uniref:EAL domain-containing response regulator n=1 Tax=Halomonas sp. HP20-15 TaxID=3085901 RepID=UPI0029823E9C|nr:EAL domain-containing response regulator [Halomonas sp. HP20-15]MDW5377662.1 EAL domain-containing response regulator [Halomonas sp. HP20-15]
MPDFDASPNAAPRVAERFLPAPAIAGKRALIIDDDREMQTLLALLLERQGYAVHIASGLEDLAHAPEQLQAELILLDFHLGEFTGIDVLQLLEEKRSQAAIILVSGCNAATGEAALATGKSHGLNMLGLLPKPFKASMLAALLARQGQAPQPLGAADLAEALREERLFLVYQPKLELASGRLVGVEALVRWQDPLRGVIPPDRFIALAEDSRQIVALSWQVLDLAFAQQARWQAAGHTFDLAINVAPQMLYEPRCLTLFDALAERHGVDLTRINLEITESATIDCLSYTRHRLNGLRERGCSLSMDDFGTGYSSMSQLYRLPFDQLKVDRTFVGASDRCSEARAITTTIVELGQRLNLKVVAEGIETPSQRVLLESLGCDYGQGYLFARPMPTHQLTGWLARHHLDAF